MTEPDKIVAWEQELYDEIESLLPDDGVIDDTCSLINEVMYLIKRREAKNSALREGLHKIAYAPEGSVGPTLSESIQIARKALGEHNGNK